MTDGYQSCCIKLVTGNQVWDKPVSYSAKNKELMFERFFVSLEDVRYLLFCNPKPKRKRKSRAKDAKVATP
jgi:hypothetical protein